MAKVNIEETIKNLENQLQHEKMINKVLIGENEELKKIIFGMNEGNYKYKKFYPYIDRLRNSLLYRGLRKIKRFFRGNKSA